MIGKTVSHYQIFEKLGEGGMGVVSSARETYLDRFMAIMVLRAEKSADRQRRARYVREAKATSALSQLNIFTIRDSAQADRFQLVRHRLGWRRAAQCWRNCYESIGPE